MRTVATQSNFAAPKTKRTAGILKTIRIAAAGKTKKRIWCIAEMKIVLKFSWLSFELSSAKVGSAA